MGPILTEFQKWQQWAQWISEDLREHLVHPRQIYRAFTEVVRANAEHIDEHGGSDFC